MTEKGSGTEWLAHLKRRVVNLVANIKDVARHVIDCLRHVDQPDYEPTKLALNRFSSLVNRTKILLWFNQSFVLPIFFFYFVSPSPSSSTSVTRSRFPSARQKKFYGKTG